MGRGCSATEDRRRRDAVEPVAEVGGVENGVFRGKVESSQEQLEQVESVGEGRPPAYGRPCGGKESEPDEWRGLWTWG